MNLKERGITVGDLLIILIIIIISTILFKPFNKGKKSSLNEANLNKLSYVETSVSNIIEKSSP